MNSRKVNLALTIAFFILLCVAVAASYYKYVVQKDFESVFYVPCEEGESGCFINTYDCEEGADLAECAFIYKAVVVNQSILDATCTPDEGECLAQVCTDNPEQCQTIYCEDPAVNYYQLSDECAEQTPIPDVQSDSI